MRCCPRSRLAYWWRRWQRPCNLPRLVTYADAHAAGIACVAVISSVAAAAAAALSGMEAQPGLTCCQGAGHAAAAARRVAHCAAATTARRISGAAGCAAAGRTRCQRADQDPPRARAHACAHVRPDRKGLLHMQHTAQSCVAVPACFG